MICVALHYWIDGAVQDAKKLFCHVLTILINLPWNQDDSIQIDGFHYLYITLIWQYVTSYSQSINRTLLFIYLYSPCILQFENNANSSYDHNPGIYPNKKKSWEGDSPPPPPPMISPEHEPIRKFHNENTGVRQWIELPQPSCQPICGWLSPPAGQDAFWLLKKTVGSIPGLMYNHERLILLTVR